MEWLNWPGHESWLGVLLGGLISTLVAAGISIAAVRATLKHDRQQRRLQLIEAAGGRVLALASRMDASLSAASHVARPTARWRLFGRPDLPPSIDRAANDPGLSDVFLDLLTAMQETAVLSRRHHRAFADVMRHLFERITAEMPVAHSVGYRERAFSTRRLHTYLRATSAAVGQWLDDPKDFSSGRVTVKQLFEHVQTTDQLSR